MQPNGKVIGLEIAEVMEVEKESYRVKLKFEAWTTEETSHWAPIATWMAGKEMGWYCLPNQGDKVLVGFHQGERHQPYVIGSLWTSEQKPPKSGENSDADINQDGKNAMRCFKTPAGHLMVFDDTEDKEKIQLIDKSGKKRLELVCGKSDDDHVINIINEKGPINVTAKNGKLTLKSKEILIEAQEKLTMKSGQAMEISSSDEMKVKASQDLKLSGMNVKTEAQQSVNLKGNVGIEAKAVQITLEASATMALKSNTLNEIKGTPVKIN